MSVALLKTTANKSGNKPVTQDDYYEIAERSLPGAGLGGYSLPKDLRFVIDRGEEGRLISVEGKEYVDYVCGAGATIIGHNHAHVIEAIKDHADKGVHFFGTLNREAIEYAEILVDAIPCAEKIIYTTTGSEATSYAMRIARAYTGKPYILKFEGAYHGNHDYASFSQFPTAAANYPHATADSGGVPEALQNTMMVAPYNELETVRSILQQHHNDIAAMIVEPIQRVILPKPGFLAGLRALADEFNVLLIFDEVVTGFRLAYGGAQEYFGVTPDMATFGKIVGGGGPLGCIGGRADILDCSNPANKGKSNYAYINGTLHGNPLAAVAGRATLNVLAGEGFYTDFHQRAQHARENIGTLIKQYDENLHIVGELSFWQFMHSNNNPHNQMEVLASKHQITRDLDNELLRNGIYVLPNVRRFFSAAHGDEELQRTLSALTLALQTVYG